VTVRAVREELPKSTTIQHVIFAMRGAAVYDAFEAAMAATASETEGATTEGATPQGIA
jgi:hypothetical protein